MRTIAVEFVDAFIDGGVGGNVAGVVLEGAAELSTEQRQDIARRAAVSETAFVLLSDTADYKLEFYTQTRSIRHCGHATVGAFARLAETGRLRGSDVVNETVDGPRRIRIQDGRAFLEQVPARLTTLDDATTHQVLASLGIGKDQLLPDGGPFLADNGNRSIQIGIADTDVLRSIRPEMDRVRDITNHLDAVCYYAFSLTSVTSGRDATARMFGPAYGIPEESATGMAAGPLACWLDTKTDRRPEGFSIEQGHMMSPPSPSLIIARPERSGRTLTSMWIGGGAKMREMRRFSIG